MNVKAHLFSFTLTKPLAILLFLYTASWAIPCRSPQLTPDRETSEVILPTYLRASYPGQNEFALSDTLFSKHFAIHYSITGSNAIDPKDSDTSGAPDYVESISAELEMLWSLYIEENGWNAPPLDAEGYYHVYLADIFDGYYGYVQPESFIRDNPQSEVVETNAYDSYMVLRNSYENFNNPEEALLATIAHEFLHSIQFAYDAWEEPWLNEGQATSMEYWVYPNLTDNFQFLESWFDSHFYPISADASLNPNFEVLNYAIWPYFYSLYQQYGGLEIGRQITEAGLSYNSRLQSAGQKAVNKALEAQQSSWRESLQFFALQMFLLKNQQLEPQYRYDPSADFLSYSPNLKLSRQELLIAEPINNLWGNGFHLYQLQFTEPTVLSFNVSHEYTLLLIDTTETLKIQRFEINELSQAVQIDSNWTQNQIHLMLFNWGSSLLASEFSVDWIPLDQRIAQFCQSEGSIDCGSFYTIEGKKIGSGSEELRDFESGIYLQKNLFENKSIYLKETVKN